MIVNSPIPSLGESLEYIDRVVVSEIYDFSKRDYWMVEVSFFKKELLIQALPEKIQDDIRTGKLMLAISNTFEGFTDIVHTIYSVITELNLPEKKIVLFSGNKEILSVVNSVALRFNREEIKCVWIRDAEFTIKQQATRLKRSIRTPDKTRTKKFLSLNRRWRPHRPIFVGLLYIRNLIDLGYVSFTEVEGFKWDNVWENLLALTRGSDIQTQLSIYKTEITSLTNLFVDKTSLEEQCSIVESITEKFYDDTYFSVVSETYFYHSDSFEKGIFLTEKTFKPMLFKHPFILMGMPNLLRTLRELGYKTFSPFINEDYDNELDPNKRLLMIVNEVERLCNLTENELNQFSKECRNICDHNIKHLLVNLRVRDLYKELN